MLIWGGKKKKKAFQKVTRIKKENLSFSLQDVNTVGMIFISCMCWGVKLPHCESETPERRQRAKRREFCEKG